jgi:hypothetical protein
MAWRFGLAFLPSLSFVSQIQIYYSNDQTTTDCTTRLAQQHRMIPLVYNRALVFAFERFLNDFSLLEMVVHGQVTTHI